MNRMCTSVAELLAGLALVGCTCSRDPGEAAPRQAVSAAVASPSGAPRVAPVRPEDLPEEQRVPTAWPIPSGPRLAILAGQGLGAIRFGATVATIERLMETPCEIRTETACRYLARAVEFVLKDGAAVEMRVHRPDRPTDPPPARFGIFNGRSPEGLAPMMLPEGVKSVLGPPLKIEPVKNGGAAGTIEIHEYKGMRLEFDKLPNGKVVVGGIVLTKA